MLPPQKPGGPRRRTWRKIWFWNKLYANMVTSQ
jgi:hypothetical protein